MNHLRYFTVEQANATLPLLELRFTKIMQLRAQLRAAYEELERVGEPPTPETLVRVGGSAQVVRARGRFRGLAEALTEEVTHIERLGIAIKDLDLGLCDFLGEREGRDVWLCWRLGEKEIAYWHELDTGFASRQPLVEGHEPSRLLH